MVQKAIRIGRPALVTRVLLYLCACLVACAISAGARAASAYRCVDSHGRLAFQDTPCAAAARQHEITLTPQPLIGTPHAIAESHARPRRARPPARRRSTRRAHPPRRKPATAWECRAADGEVFYRFTRCPSSVSGDGVVRTDYAEQFVSAHGRKRHDAWSRVRVHGVKISRAQACQGIRGVAGASRDGYLRDAKLSVYDHLMGRGPCAGD